MTRPKLDDIAQRADMAEKRGYDFLLASSVSAADVPALLAVIRDVLAAHAEATCSRGYPQAYCDECDQAWPCATVRAVTAHIDTTPKEN